MILLAAALSAACATKPVQLSDREFDEKLAETELKADALGKEGKLNEASASLKGLAALNTARKEPWLRLARLHFEGGNYGEAITAADEVLQRDPADLSAKSIRAVSGLRVATRSLEDIQQDQTLAGAARPDARRLAMVLRATLGEDVLVPPVVVVEPPPEPEVRKPVRKRRVRRARPARPASPTPTPAAQLAPASGNPFGVLQ